MDMANYISVKMELLKPEIRNEIRELLEKIWEGYNIKNIDQVQACEAVGVNAQRSLDRAAASVSKDPFAR